MSPVFWPAGNRYKSLNLIFEKEGADRLDFVSCQQLLSGIRLVNKGD